MLDSTNQLRGSYEDYQVREARRACSEIPKDRRQRLREEIEMKAILTEVSNPKAYKAALIALQ